MLFSVNLSEAQQDLFTYSDYKPLCQKLPPSFHFFSPVISGVVISVIKIEKWSFNVGEIEIWGTRK